MLGGIRLLFWEAADLQGLEVAGFLFGIWRLKSVLGVEGEVGR